MSLRVKTPGAVLSGETPDPEAEIVPPDLPAHGELNDEVVDAWSTGSFALFFVQ